jgi:hypothetical protein
MNRTNFAPFTDRALVASLLIAASALAGLSPACSSSTSPPNSGTDASAGGDGGANGAGGRATGGAVGSGGKAAGGATGTGGNAAGGAGGGTTPDTDAGDAGVAPLTPLTGTALVAGSDFTTHVGEVVAVDLSTGHATGRASFSDGDIGVSVDGGRIFVLERGNNALNVLSATGAVTKRIVLDLGDGGPSYLNPHAPLVVTGTSKAYVPLNAANAIAIVDLDTGAQSGAISLAAFLDATDNDGSTEPDSVSYDAATHRAYFILGRTDIFSGSASTDYTPKCPPVPALIIAVDTTTNAIVDLNGDGGGVGIALPLVGPSSLTLETSGGLLIVADGCSGVEADGGFLRTRHGILSVDLGARTAKVLFPGATNDYLDGLLALGDGTYALSQANGSKYHRFDPSSPTQLGAALTSVPSSAISGGAGTLLGLALGKTADGGVEQQVVRYDVSTQKVSAVAAFRWSSDFSYYSMAWVK